MRSILRTLFLCAFVWLTYVLDAQQCTIAKYLLEGNALDSTQNQINGQVYGAVAVNDRFGNPNGAFFFDGVDDYIHIPHNELLNFDVDDEFSISVWLKADPQQNSIHNRSEIITKWIDEPGAGTNEGYPYALRIENRNIQEKGFVFGLRFDRNYGNFPEVNTTKSLLDNQFHHLLFIKEPDSIKIFLDGNLMSSSLDITTCTTKNDDPLYIGRRGGDINASYFKGIIDEVEFFSCVANPDSFPITPPKDTIPEETFFEADEISVYPNPFKTFTVLETGKLYENSLLRIVNVLGQEVANFRVNTKKIILSKSELAAGVYFFQLLEGDRVVFSGKLVSIRCFYFSFLKSISVKLAA